jgi:hypothetical protein
MMTSEPTQTTYLACSAVAIRSGDTVLYEGQIFTVMEHEYLEGQPRGVRLKLAGLSGKHVLHEVKVGASERIFRRYDSPYSKRYKRASDEIIIDVDSEAIP